MKIIKFWFCYLNSKLYTTSSIDVIVHFANESTNSFYYSNSIYVTTAYKISVISVNIHGADGNFSSFIHQSTFGPYTYFYTENGNLKGLSATINGTLISR